jgi:ribosomal protein L7Ae-like RNA K-turn-binding protein
MIGLAAKAGKVVSGEFSVETAVKKGKAFLVICARDASDASKKSYRDACRYYDVPLCEYGTKESLGKFSGKEYRSAAAVTDEGFAKAIMKLLDQQHTI